MLETLANIGLAIIGISIGVQLVVLAFYLIGAVLSSLVDMLRSRRYQRWHDMRTTNHE